MSAIGTDRLCRPVGKHFRCLGLTGSAAAVPVLLSLTQSGCPDPIKLAVTPLEAGGCSPGPSQDHARRCQA